MPSPLRVLLISGEYPPMQGGVADFTYLLGETMVELGAEVHVLTSVGAATQKGKQGAVHPHPLMRSWRWKPLYATLRRLLDEIGPDIVNIQYQTAAYALHPAINFLPIACHKVPTVVTFHDLLVPYLFPKAGRLRWWTNLALARWSDAVIVTNVQDKARMKAHSWIRHLALVPIGSNLACSPPAGYDRTAWRERWGIGEDTLVLCYFGFLNASKGGEELVAALDALCATGRDARLLMMGGVVGASDPTNRTYLDLVRSLIRERDLENRVLWTGYLKPEEVSGCFGAADICVLPYRDGASFRRGSFLAALTHGMPIVTTRPQVALTQLVHGKNVWLVPVGDVAKPPGRRCGEATDPKAIAEALALLADDPKLRQTLGDGARELSEQFGWQRIAARTMEVYDRALAAK